MNCKIIIQLALLLVFPLLAFCKEDAEADILVFVIDGSQSNDYASAIQTFKKYDISHNVVSIQKTGISNEELENYLYKEVDGQKLPKYKVLVFPNGRVSYDRADYSRTENSDWQSALKYEQWEMFYDYSRNFDTRLVFLNEYPSNYTSTELIHEYKGDEAKKMYQSNQVIIPEEGINEEETLKNAKLTTEGIYHFPARIVDLGNGVTADPILYFGENQEFPEKSVAAVSVNNNGAQYIAFFMAFGEWSKDSTALNIVWLTWATEKDLKHLSGKQISTEDALKESSAQGLNKFEIILAAVATAITLIITIF